MTPSCSCPGQALDPGKDHVGARQLHVLPHTWPNHSTLTVPCEHVCLCNVALSAAAFSRIAAAGEAGAASALACNTACALLTFWVLWWALGPPPGVGHAMAVRRLCQV